MSIGTQHPARGVACRRTAAAKGRLAARVTSLLSGQCGWPWAPERTRPQPHSIRSEDHWLRRARSRRKGASAAIAGRARGCGWCMACGSSSHQHTLQPAPPCLSCSEPAQSGWMSQQNGARDGGQGTRWCEDSRLLLAPLDGESKHGGTQGAWLLVDDTELDGDPAIHSLQSSRERLPCANGCARCPRPRCWMRDVPQRRRVVRPRNGAQASICMRSGLETRANSNALGRRHAHGQPCRCSRVWRRRHAAEIAGARRASVQLGRARWRESSPPVELRAATETASLNHAQPPSWA